MLSSQCSSSGTYDAIVVNLFDVVQDIKDFVVISFSAICKKITMHSTEDETKNVLLRKISELTKREK